MPRPSVHSVIEVVVLIAILLVIAAVATPGYISSRRASNERNTSTSLKTLSSAEADFRFNDRDWNGVNDFWTADVKGLYTLKVSGAPGAPTIKLIEPTVAAADADGTFHPAAGRNTPLDKTARLRAKAGYWYAALITDQSIQGTPESTYKVETGGTPRMGPVHNTSKFGFLAFPDTTSQGKYLFLINENNSVFRAALTAAQPEFRAPPGLQALPPGYLHWPSDIERRSYWSMPQ